jgi:glycosyltransferase involved in cell wall biosynthesis
MSSKMRILHVTTFAAGGGAARAAARLRQGCRDIGLDTQLLVQGMPEQPAPGTFCKQKLLPRLTADLRRHLDALPVRFSKTSPVTSFAPAVVPDRFPARVAELAPDIVHLHWLGAGFCRLESLARLRRPLVWTLHDMWAFTGGCFYAGDCSRYRERCGQCPQLGSARNFDLSRRTWLRKARTWPKLDLTVVTPSRWMADCARQSSLLRDRRIEVIPNGIETDLYQPLDRQRCREILNLPEDRKFILFGAINATSDRRKGFQYLQPALQSLAQQGWQGRAELLIYGANRPAAPPDLGLPARYLGYLHDDRSLANLYAAADLAVVPSVEDNLPNVVVEALACGTPCVAFAIGGMPDMIAHQENGYLARPFEVDDLARGMDWVLKQPGAEGTLRKNARQKAEQNYTLERVARLHLDLYRDILKTSGHG